MLKGLLFPSQRQPCWSSVRAMSPHRSTLSPNVAEVVTCPHCLHMQRNVGGSGRCVGIRGGAGGGGALVLLLAAGARLGGQ